MSADTSKDVALRASYSSPTSAPFNVEHSIPAPASASPLIADKTRYLGALRAALGETQAFINKELTQRMEEDKAREAAAGGSAGGTKGVDDEKEEENYGEDVQAEEE